MLFHSHSCGVLTLWCQIFSLRFSRVDTSRKFTHFTQQSLNSNSTHQLHPEKFIFMNTPEQGELQRKIVRHIQGNQTFNLKISQRQPLIFE